MIAIVNNGMLKLHTERSQDHIARPISAMPDVLGEVVQKLYKPALAKQLELGSAATVDLSCDVGLPTEELDHPDNIQDWERGRKGACPYMRRGLRTYSR